MKKSHQYTFTYLDESEYNIVGYIPAAMKVHYANYHSFCYLCARLCYKKVGGDIFIINGYSSWYFNMMFDVIGIKSNVILI